MIVFLFVIKFVVEKNLLEEELIRGLFVLYFIIIYVKINVGRFFVYCGVICVVFGVVVVFIFLYGGSFEMVCDVIINILGNFLGVICDGVKVLCVMKIFFGIYFVFDVIMFVLNKDVLKFGDGIVGVDIEEIIRNVGEFV